MTEKNIGRLFSILGYTYIIIPFCIFLVGWCKWFVWVPGIIILAFCLFSIIKNAKIDFKISFSKKIIFKLITILLILALWVLLSGLGKLAFQSDDHQWRNGIFEMLVNNNWPVATTINGKNLMLVYYLAFWMPSALIGKAFGVAAGYIFQIIWAFIGIIIAYSLICFNLNKIKVWPLIVFVFFSGLDILGWPIEKRSFAGLTWGTHLEWWTPFELSSFTTQLFWVFNQAIIAWIVFLLIKLQKTNRYRIFILAFAVLASPFAFIGMIPFLIYWILKEHINEDKKIHWKELLKGLCSIENILGGGFVGLLSFFYLQSNMSGQIFGASSYYESKYFVLHLLISAFFEYALFCVVMFKTQKKNALFYITIGCLFVFPWFAIGSGTDFCMRATIPALIILYLLIVETLEKSKKEKQKSAMIALICLLIIGATTPIQEMTRAIIHSPKENITVSEEQVWENDNFIGSSEQGIFNKYLSK